MTVNQISGQGGYGVMLDTIFPLPLVHELGPRPHGRGQVRAWLRDKRREEDINALISSLNCFSGPKVRVN